MEEIYSAIIIISIVLLMLSGGIVFAIVNYKDKQSRYLSEKKNMEAEFSAQLLQSRVEVQEITVAALSKELHDNIGQLLSSAKMFIGICIRNSSEDNDVLKLADDTLAQAIGELRTIARSLDREWLEKFDLLTNLKTEIQRLKDASNIEVNFEYPDSVFLEADRQIILFRIIQEAIQNAVKHSNATALSIKLTTAEQLLVASVVDNGCGFETREKHGMGINNMRHRSALLMGEISWTRLTKGTKVCISLPVNRIKNEN